MGKEVPGWPLLCILRVPVGESGKQGYSGWIWPGYSKALKMVHKLVKQYWEEHDAEISIRSKEGHLVQGQGWNTGKRNKDQVKKNPESYWKEQHCQTDLPAAMKCPPPCAVQTAVWLVECSWYVTQEMNFYFHFNQFKFKSLNLKLNSEERK